MVEPLPGLERQPDAMEKIAVEGGEVMTYSFGSGENVLLLVNGGPGLACDYLRDSHSHLANGDLRVVTWDQLGTGRSDRLTDPALWTVARYAREMEQVRTGLSLGPVHALGQSWGGWMVIEHALAFPDGIRSLILSNTTGEVPFLQAEQNRLRSSLGSATMTMMLKREAEGSTDHPEYLGAIEILNWRHVHRLEIMPAALQRSMEGVTFEIYQHMWGPNEFVCIGNLATFDRLADMANIACPCLIVVGEHDELTPACAMRMHHVLPDSRIKVFTNASHSTCFETPEPYFRELSAFLDHCKH
ncbi:MAG: proline iminopeptidase-family hydrolase [Rhodospirillaceae bacterium]|jgi:proline iminopeptidase|nr:proline iminopeptidase-family hydrolase [Rhodospirillaceae bacterium]MBT6511583.1 proline iminopeptidase-family hydrolase [Rhodospirillaceae bacterium]MBT7614772.1 proline iminopeptidase-family hydrolase [Rhodospirillaceae bacterium]MBT7646306.1 proline iminopeptidase-family hydrolase [Rhodospirillaceae bacterium]